MVPAETEGDHEEEEVFCRGRALTKCVTVCLLHAKKTTTEEGHGLETRHVSCALLINEITCNLDNVIPVRLHQ